jgi:hypothetical protein
MVADLKGTIKKAMSDEVEVDFSAARDGDFAPIPPGEYVAKVISAKADRTKEGNHPKVVFRFEIDAGQEYAGRTFFKHCRTTGPGSGILRDILRALGFDVDSMTAFRPADAVGRTAVITVRFQKDSDEFQEISKVRPVDNTKKPVARKKL